ncbi:MAG: transposase, partial [Coriobacteriia bacterium]|nr:transposase [Coriobacteriia bacterium]
MPGYVEMDTVAHCGESTRGQYVVTLDVTDIETQWSEQRACLNKAEKHVFAEVKEVRLRLLFKLLGADTDGGGEFINNHMFRYCKEQKIVFTRGRPYKKNDGCHIEQKNWSIVRQTVGYGRFETQRECDLLNMVYDYVRLINNFFMPSQRLGSKTRDGGRVVRKM